MSSAAWDKGAPTAVRMIDREHFTVESFRGEGRTYEVDLQSGCCTCPHYAARLAGTGKDCKHLEAVKAQKPFLIALARAKELTDAALAQYLLKYAQNPVVSGALRVERQARRQEAARLARLGTSVRLPGSPENEARKELFR